MSALRDARQALANVIVSAIRVWPAGAAWALVTFPLAGLVGPVAAFALGRTIDAAATEADVRVVGWVAVLACAVVVGQVIRYANDEYVRHRLFVLVEHDTTSNVMGASLRAAGVEHLEDPSYAATVNAVRSAPQRFEYLTYATASFVSGIAGVAAATVALASIDPLLAVAPVGAGIAGLVHFRAPSRRRAIEERAWENSRRNVHSNLCTEREAAAELRVLGLAHWAAQRSAAHHARGGAYWVELAVFDARLRLASAALHGAVLSGIAVAILRLGASAQASAGEVAMGIGLAQQLFHHTNAVTRGVTTFARFRHVADAFDQLVNHESSVKVAATPAPPPRRLDTGVHLDGVSFSYPGAERPALQDVSLDLAAGTTVALVGPNGAGKTTLAKLLCRFYDPTSGTISIDGARLESLNLDSYRRSIRAAFQDFARYEFTLREAIGVGDIAALDDETRIRAAAATVGADTLVHALGLDQQLGSAFGGGTELSTGQWQKIALARAAMREAPLVTVLDEPTAALDPRAEHEVFERFAAIASEGRNRGAITIIVSHRFSTVLMADVMAVLEGGRVIEVGSHEQLMAAGGSYAEMFTLQASSYRP